ncbi:MAG: diguanylate cyclase [Planctomycetes bacterium]|nr:diguanylate cyclase [Planctomycetota bacterium]MCB9903165.1 diguanylate cyclase [Planctomycetota bacterium]
MNDTFEQFRLSGKLPSPSGVGMRILKLTQSDDFSTEEIGQAIMADSALTGRLLKLANSAQSGSVRQITTVAEATTRLGISTVRNLALGLSLISENRAGTCDAFDYDRYWATSLARAVAAQVLSTQTRVGVPAEMYILGLLSEVGILALASVYPERFSEHIPDVKGRTPQEIAALERKLFEIDHHNVAACMLEEWGLPEAFQGAVKKYEYLELGPRSELGSQVEILRAADLIAELLVADEFTTPARWRAFDRELRWLMQASELEEEAFFALCRSIVGEWREWGQVLHIPTQKPADLENLEDEAVKAERRGLDENAPRPRHKLEEDPTGSAKVVEPEFEGDGGGTHILIVDDDPLSLKVLERHLVRAGYRVSTAKDGNEALEVVLRSAPQMVIADWMMPGMNGIDLCASLRRIESGRKIYFLLVTGENEDENVVRAFDAGVDDYLHKPLNPKILLARVKGGKRIIDLQRQVEKDQQVQRRHVAELQLLTRKLRTAALTDALTGLPNRRYAMRRLSQVWESTQRTGNPLSIIMIDIDHFKSVNDEHGHDAGDVVLKETAKAMREAMREEEDICRIGGEEFLIICINTDIDGARVAAERIRKRIETNLIKWGSFHRPVTLSLGISQKVDGMESYDELLKESDQAVYLAKASGRNRVCSSAEVPTDKRRTG